MGILYLEDCGKNYNISCSTCPLVVDLGKNLKSAKVSSVQCDKCSVAYLVATVSSSGQKAMFCILCGSNGGIDEDDWLRKVLSNALRAMPRFSSQLTESRGRGGVTRRRWRGGHRGKRRE
ncbi:hypothetical protein ACOME3_008512 [Neoechinorhynchus agilis]